MPNDGNSPEPGEILGQLVFGKCMTMAVSVAAKLRIADQLASGPKSAADLAKETNTHGPTLYRVLRALASFGIFSESSDGKFSQTPTSELLTDRRARFACAVWPSSAARNGAGRPGAI